MLAVVIVTAVMATLSSAMVCLPEMCNDVTQPLLDCQGGVIKNGGFCGCTDVCAKVEGETCQAQNSFGMMNSGGTCDLGLHCVQHDTADTVLAFGLGTCVRSRPDVDLGVRHEQKRETVSRTRCEQMRMSSMISMVVYRGQWFAKCDSQGNFLPLQCDNTQQCFCVDTLTGEVQENTKGQVFSATDCQPASLSATQPASA